MRIFRLAQILENKYAKEETPEEKVMYEVRRDVHLCYENYVNPDSPKNRNKTLFTWGDRGEPNCQQLVTLIGELDSKINKLNSLQSFNMINTILSFLKPEMKEKVRNFINNFQYIGRHSDTDNKETAKKKFESTIDYISSMLTKKAKLLAGYLVRNNILKLEEVTLAGGWLPPQRGDINRERLKLFLFSPMAQEYGIDSFETWEKLHNHPEVREDLITLFNAFERARIPKEAERIKANIKSVLGGSKIVPLDGPEVKELLDKEIDVEEDAARKKREEEKSLLNKYNSLYGWIVKG